MALDQELAIFNYIFCGHFTAIHLMVTFVVPTNLDDDFLSIIVFTDEVFERLWGNLRLFVCFCCLYDVYALVFHVAPFWV